MPREAGEWACACIGRHTPHLRRGTRASRAPLRRYVGAQVLGFAGAGGFLALYPVLVPQLFAVPVAAAAATLAGAAAVGAVAYRPAARVAARVGAARTLTGTLAVRAAALGGLVLAVLARAPGVVALVLVGVLVVAWSAQSVAGAAVVAALRPGDEGAGLGAGNTAAALGGMGGALGAGLLADLAGYPAVLMAATAAVALAAVLAAPLVVARPPRRLR